MANTPYNDALETVWQVTKALQTALEYESLTFKVTGPLLDVVWQDLNNLANLIDAWREHQPLPEVLQKARQRTPPDDTDA